MLVGWQADWFGLCVLVGWLVGWLIYLLLVYFVVLLVCACFVFALRGLLVNACLLYLADSYLSFWSDVFVVGVVWLAGLQTWTCWFGLAGFGCLAWGWVCWMVGVLKVSHLLHGRLYLEC